MHPLGWDSQMEKVQQVIYSKGDIKNEDRSSVPFSSRFHILPAYYFLYIQRFLTVGW